MSGRLSRLLPYVVVLAVASYLHFLAGRIDFVAPGGRIGPNVWPKAVLALATLTCLYEVAKILFFTRTKAGSDLKGVLGTVLKDAPQDAGAAEAGEHTYPWLLWTGIGLTVLYVVLIEKLGFFTCTLLYLALFMWVGRYRRPGVILASSLIGSLAFMFMFMKVVYVSLPLGTGPFAQVSYFLMRLMNIK